MLLCRAHVPQPQETFIKVFTFLVALCFLISGADSTNSTVRACEFAQDETTFMQLSRNLRPGNPHPRHHQLSQLRGETLDLHSRGGRLLPLAYGRVAQNPEKVAEDAAFRAAASQTPEGYNYFANEALEGAAVANTMAENAVFVDAHAEKQAVEDVYAQEAEADRVAAERIAVSHSVEEKEEGAEHHAEVQDDEAHYERRGAMVEADLADRAWKNGALAEADLVDRAWKNGAMADADLADRAWQHEVVAGEEWREEETGDW